MNAHFIFAILIVFFSNFNLIFAETERFLLITGCARSGTGYITNLMQKCGLNVLHEEVGADGSVSWPMMVQSTTCPWGAPRNNLKFQHIFHQVRHPLKVISSTFMTEGAESWSFIMEHIPEIKPEDPYIVKSAKYWLYWNINGDELAEWTYRVENIEQIWDEFETRLGRKLDCTVLNMVSKTTNERKFKPLSRGNNILEKDFTWDDLKRELDPELYQKIRALAQKYGYSLEELPEE